MDGTGLGVERLGCSKGGLELRQPRFETAHPDWQWLHETQFIGTGVRRPDGVLLSIYKVL